MPVYKNFKYEILIDVIPPPEAKHFAYKANLHFLEDTVTGRSADPGIREIVGKNREDAFKRMDFRIKEWIDKNIITS